MPRKLQKAPKNLSLGQYQHRAKRVNNPEVGLVSSSLDSRPVKKTYKHDPYIDPHLSWAGKEEGISFEVDTVSLHIHERIDPKRVIKQVLKNSGESVIKQPSLFEQPSEKLTQEREFDFYGHTKNWSNRLVAGDSLLVMNSLLEKEKMTGKVQMVYIDPPYGIRFNSNFQPFVNKKDVKDKDDDSIPAEPEMIQAFRDTWELGIHSYLSSLRDRLLLAKDLLHESGSIFIQINDENVNYIKDVMSEVFGAENWVDIIPFWKTSGLQENYLASVCDYLVWFAKDKSQMKYRQLYLPKNIGGNGAGMYKNIELVDGTTRPLSKEEIITGIIPLNGKVFRGDNLTSQGNPLVEFEYMGKKYTGRWKTNLNGLKKLAEEGRILIGQKTLSYKRYLEDFPVFSLTNLWTDTGTGGEYKIYVVQTNDKVIQRCMLMTSDPGDIVLDPTCGGGTTAYVAEQWGRRWITCDTSRVAVQLAKQRLMTAKFDYYELARPEEGVSSGFKYKTVPHITLGSIANSEQPKEETLYDQPYIDKEKVRVTGPFTVEAVPGIRTKPITGELPDVSDKSNPTNLISEKLSDYLDSIRTSGIRSYHGQEIKFNSVEIADGFFEVHALGTISENENYSKCVIIFGPDYAPMEQTQIERAMDEVRTMSDKPQLVIFCSYAFDPEASKDIDNIKISGIQILKAQMNTDLLTKDLKKKANTNKPFWLIGEPDIEIKKLTDGKYQVEVKGFDYYDPKTQEVGTGGTEKIAMWMLDTNYDNRSIFPTQIFFPIHDDKRDWTKLAKALNGEVDEDLLEQYTGTISIPFNLGDNKTIAVKIVDDRGVEMLVVKKL